MLPYFHLVYIELGPVKIYIWGFFVSLGFLAALIYLIKKEPERKEVFIDLLLYVLIGSMIGARLFYVLFYAPETLTALKDFWKIWQGGMSSLGGLFGGAVATLIFSRLKKIKFLWLANSVAFVLPLGLGVARIGCYLMNDHPGIKATASFLSVAYPDGPRYDAGLLMLIFNVLIFVYFLSKKQPFFALANFLLIYGAGRFIIDMLRVDDPVFAGLIPSQYGSIIMMVIGFYLINNSKKYVA